MQELSTDHSVIGTMWAYKNKLNEYFETVNNKARLVAQGYYQEEGIGFDKTIAPVGRLKSINMILAFAY